MGFSASVTSSSDLAHLTVLGELDAFTALELRRPVGHALARGCRHFTVSLGDLTFIDAGGLGALVGLHNAVYRIDGSVTFVEVSQPFRRMCGYAGLTETFLSC